MRVLTESEELTIEHGIRAMGNAVVRSSRLFRSRAGYTVHGAQETLGRIMMRLRSSGCWQSSIPLRTAYQVLPNYKSIMLLFCILCCVNGFGQQASESKKDLIERARTFAVAGKLSKAKSLLDDELRRDPDSAYAHFLLGYIYFHEKHARQSLAEFTAGARTQNPSLGDLRIVASDYVLLGDFTDAAKWFGVVASEQRKDPDNWYLLGRAQYSENHFRGAIASFQKALSLRPHFIRAENNLGLAWEGMNNMKQATNAFHVAIEWQGGHPTNAQPFLNLGTVLINSAHLKQALHYLKIAVSLVPQNPEIREELARCYTAQKDFRRAERQLEVAVKIAPKAAGLHYELGRIYRREGLDRRAQHQFNICARLNGTQSAVATPNPYSPN